MLHFIAILFRFGKEFLLQLYYFRQYVSPLLKQKLANTDDSFSQKYVRRMSYYAYFVPAVAAANYSILLNRKLSSTERITMTRLAAAAPIFDDYFDAEVLQYDRLSKMIAAPEAFVATSTLESILVDLLILIKQSVPNFSFFMKVCQSVFDAQIASKKQKNGQLHATEIRKITYDKGGYSTLLFKSVMAHEPIKGENEAIYHFGGLVQLVDDIFDMYEDAKENIQTLATMETQISSLTKAFTNDLLHLCTIFHSLGLAPKAVQQFLYLQLFFFTRTFVCLQQFGALQPTNTPFLVKKFNRKSLICDMEKWKNIRLWIQYFQKFKKFAHQA